MTSFRVLAATTLLLTGACSSAGVRGSATDPAFAALPDTVVCVVDRTAPTGLRNLEAKVDPQLGEVIRVNGRTVPLSVVHPVRMVAGYAGAERWVRSAEPITFGGRRFRPVPEERRVPIELLTRVGDHQGVPLFGSRNESQPEVLYIPLRPGCVFRAYVREDLL